MAKSGPKETGRYTSAKMAGGLEKSTDPKLHPNGLQDNGGPTQTIALQPTSPAIDAILFSTNGCGTTITTDQRGVARPQGTACDIGAFELVLMPPVANNDSYSAKKNKTLTVLTPGVLANDTDPNSKALTSQLVSGPRHGTLTLSPDGSFTYKPNKKFKGADTFTYKANDGALESNTATVSITVSKGKKHHHSGGAHHKKHHH